MKHNVLLFCQIVQKVHAYTLGRYKCCISVVSEESVHSFSDICPERSTYGLNDIRLDWPSVHVGEVGSTDQVCFGGESIACPLRSS